MATHKLPVATTERNRLVADLAVRGLFQRFQNGRRTWVVRYTIAGRSRQLTLAATKVADARLEASAILQQARIGIDVVAKNTAETLVLRAEAKAKREAARVQQHRSVGALVDRYCARAMGSLRPKTVQIREHYLREVLLPLHGEDAETVAKSRITAVLGDIADERGEVTRNRVLSALGVVLNWAVGEALIERVASNGIPRLKEQARDRALDVEELRRVYLAAGELGAAGPVIRLLALLGQRRSEVADLTWREVDLATATIVLPSARVKNGRAHVVPLPAQAISILEAQEHRDDGRVFRKFAWDREKARLDAIVPLAEPWVLHDLRRSAVTHMCELGIAPHVVEAVVNHVSGHKSGVAGVYNKATYAAEKRAALQRWADHLLEAGVGNVVQLVR